MGLFYRRQEGSFHLCFWLATNSCSSWNTISWNKSQYLFIGFLTKSWVGHSNFTFYSSLTKWPAQIHFFLIIWFGFPNVWCKCLSFPHCVLHVQLFKTVFCICSTFHNCGVLLLFLHSAAISVSPVLARPPILHTWRANPTDDIATVKTNLKDVYICMHSCKIYISIVVDNFTKLSISVLPLVMLLSWKFCKQAPQRFC